MAETNEQLLRRFLALWSVRDAAGMADCFAEEGVYDNVPDAKPMVGRAAIRAWLDGVFEQLSRIDVEILTLAQNGEWILCERIDDHIKDEKHMCLPVANATRIVDGRIVMFRDYYDYDTVRALGII